MDGAGFRRLRSMGVSHAGVDEPQSSMLDMVRNIPEAVLEEVVAQQPETLKKFENETRIRARKEKQAESMQSVVNREQREKSYLLKQDRWYLIHIEREKRTLAALNHDIRALKTQLAEMRILQGGIGAARLQSDLTQRSLASLENRISTSRLALNRTEGRNRELKGELDSKHGDRKIFDGIYRKLGVAIHEEQKKLGLLQVQHHRCAHNAARSFLIFSAKQQ